MLFWRFCYIAVVDFISPYDLYCTILQADLQSDSLTVWILYTTLPLSVMPSFGMTPGLCDKKDISSRSQSLVFVSARAGGTDGSTKP